MVGAPLLPWHASSIWVEVRVPVPVPVTVTVGVTVGVTVKVTVTVTVTVEIRVTVRVTVTVTVTVGVRIRVRIYLGAFTAVSLPFVGVSASLQGQRQGLLNGSFHVASPAHVVISAADRSVEGRGGALVWLELHIGTTNDSGPIRANTNDIR